MILTSNQEILLKRNTEMETVKTHFNSTGSRTNSVNFKGYFRTFEWYVGLSRGLFEVEGHRSSSKQHRSSKKLFRALKTAELYIAVTWTSKSFARSWVENNSLLEFEKNWVLKPKSFRMVWRRIFNRSLTVSVPLGGGVILHKYHDQRDQSILYARSEQTTTKSG